MAGRFICAVGCLLLIGATCSAGPARATSADQGSVALDVMAGKLAGAISRSKMISVVVVGFSGPGKKVSELGPILRDEVSDSLARQAPSVKVFNRTEISAMLKQNRVAEPMIFNASMGDWIATHIHADGYVTAHFEIPISGPSPITMEIFKCRADGCSRVGLPIVAEFALTTAEFLAGGRDFEPTLPATAEPGADGVTRPKCVQCPDAQYTEEARKAKISGTVQLIITVEPDGTTNDIFIQRPLSHGLDGAAIDAVAKWKFEPAVDAQGHPVATHLTIEVSFNLK
jgi:TonB family protein